jgi:hypothetical protein
VVNEYGEIRNMTLTPTKAHDQFMPALSKIPFSLRQYGHSDIELVYTDSVRGDKAELERIFPSLVRDVHPVPSSTLPSLSLPDGWSVSELGTTYQVNMRLDSLMEDLQTISGDAYVAMDMEWPVDLQNGIQGRVSLIQLAFHQQIYLMPVC